MAIKGLKNLVYAKITEENETVTTYNDIKRLGPAMALGIVPSVNRSNLRADDGVIFSDSSKGAVAVTLNTAYLEKAVEADLLGKTVHENGLISDNKGDEAPYVAIGGMAKSARGGYEFFWIYRVKFAPAEENKETEQETPAYQTPNLTGEAIPRLHDGEERTKLWDGDESVTDKTIFEEWFNEVIDKDWVATI